MTSLTEDERVKLGNVVRETWPVSPPEVTDYFRGLSALTDALPPVVTDELDALVDDASHVDQPYRRVALGCGGFQHSEF